MFHAALCDGFNSYNHLHVWKNHTNKFVLLMKKMREPTKA